MRIKSEFQLTERRACRVVSKFCDPNLKRLATRRYNSVGIISWHESCFKFYGCTVRSSGILPQSSRIEKLYVPAYAR